MTPVRSHMPFPGHRSCAEWMICPVRTIQKAVAHYYGLSLDDLLSSSRDRRLARPRQVAMYLAAELTDQSDVALAGRFGRDRKTFAHGCQNIAALLKSEPIIEEDVHLLRNWLTEHRDFPQLPAGAGTFPLAQTGPARIVNSETGRGGDPNPASDQTACRRSDMAAEPLYRAPDSAQYARGCAHG